MKTENTEPKSADALACELAERCAKTVKEAQDKLVVVNRCEEMLTNRLFVLNIKEIILRETKLGELCAVAEALRMAIHHRPIDGADTVDGRDYVMIQMDDFNAAQQVLAALDGGGK